MEKIVIISSSVRRGRKSHRVTLWFERYLVENGHPGVQIADLREYNFPLFDERLIYQDIPSEAMLDFAAKISSADGVIIVVPEYNGGYPSSLNFIDLLTKMASQACRDSDCLRWQFWRITGNNLAEFTLWKMGALTVPSTFRVPKFADAFDENGTPDDKAAIEKRTAMFIQELLWTIEARRRMGDS